jgi:hypothetical protein
VTRGPDSPGTDDAAIGRHPYGRTGWVSHRDREVAMDIGPVQYVVLGFPGNRFTGRIAPALRELVERGTIRILDLVFVQKDDQGDVVSFEYDAIEEDDAFASIEREASGMLNEDDIASIAAGLEPNSSAALLVWEDLWAAPLADALREANGVIVNGARIPRDVVQRILDEQPAAG